MSQSLFYRLGSNNGITSIANDIVDSDALKNAAATFFIAGTGGADIYKRQRYVG